jgi:hypothetical protein
LGELKFARPNSKKSWCNSCAPIVQFVAFLCNFCTILWSKIALVFFSCSSCNSLCTQLLPNASLGFERTLNSLYLARSWHNASLQRHENVKRQNICLWMAVRRCRQHINDSDVRIDT